MTVHSQVVLLAIVLLLNLGCSTNDERKEKEGGSLGTPDSPIISEQLVEVFQRGPEAVKTTYVGKTLVVRGKIIGIDGAPGQVILSGQTGDPNSLPGISCKPNAQSVGNFQLLRLGDVITARGEAHHAGKGFLFLRECTLVEKAGK